MITGGGWAMGAQFRAAIPRSGGLISTQKGMDLSMMLHFTVQYR